MKFKRLQLPKLLLASLLTGLGCAIFMISTFTWELQEGKMLPIDVYWFYFGAVPKDWMSHFEILHFMFVLAPITLIAYFVSNDIQTNMMETKYMVVIRYQSIRRWMISGCKACIAISVCFIMIFHLSFLLACHMRSWNDAGAAQSVYEDGQLGSLWVLILKQVFLVSTLSMIQLLVAVRHNIQTGVLAELCVGGAVVFFDLLHLSEKSFFCADLGFETTIDAMICFAAILVFLLLCASNKASEKYLG